MFALALFLVTGAEPPLATAGAIRALTRDEANEHRPVDLTGVVTFVSATESDFFLQDGTAGVYVDRTPLALKLSAGDRVRLTGTTDPGTFAPMVIASGLELLGRAPLPDPVLHLLDPDDNRWLDARYCEARAYVNARREVGTNHQLLVSTSKGRAVVYLPLTGADRDRVEALVGKVVRFRAVCDSPSHDPQTGIARPLGRFRLSSISDIDPIPGDPISPYPVALSTVRAGPATGPVPFARPITVRGSITHELTANGTQSLVIQDATGAARVNVALPAKHTVGETVLVTGFPVPHPTGLLLDNAHVAKSPVALPAPVPAPTTPEQVARGARWGQLVTLVGEVLSVATGDDELTIACASGAHRFEVWISTTEKLSPHGELRPGTTIRATGCAVPFTYPHSDSATTFRVLVNGSDAITVLAEPPTPAQASWWTAERVAKVGTVLAAVGALVALWIWLLRRRVNRLVAEVRARYDHEAELERGLQEARRLEALGRLTSGLTHDFNNLLTIILNGIELASQAAVRGSAQASALDAVAVAGRRAADLTQQLLSFARQQEVRLEPLDLAAVLTELEPLLQVTAGRTVALTRDAAPNLPHVLADRGTLSQVLLNLAANARDAMPDGGTFSLSLARGGTAEAPRVVLTVSDTGCGMDGATAARVFEPFFTTKPVGKGTGLGLATVYGIVRDLKGTIAVKSEVGRGTTFVIEFPAIEAQAPPESAPESATPAPPPVPILLVDDDPLVRGTTVAILRKYGYTVDDCESGAIALEHLRKTPSAFAALVTDVTMPDLNGPELVRQARALVPTLPVLFMSGNLDELDQHDRGANTRYLQKPFPLIALVSEVQELLAPKAQ